MKPLIPLLVASGLLATAHGSLILTGVIDGDLTGGLPKAIVITATADIADLSTYGVGSANNGQGSDGQEVTFAGGLTAGATVLVVSNAVSSDFFTTHYSDSFTIFINGAASINGDDAVELYSSSLVIDTYGDIDTNGDGETWDYTDGYAVRTGGDAGPFLQSNYDSQYKGLDGKSEEEQATVIAGAYGFTQVPEPSIVLLGGLGFLGLLRRRR